MSFDNEGNNDKHEVNNISLDVLETIDGENSSSADEFESARERSFDSTSKVDEGDTLANEDTYDPNNEDNSSPNHKNITKDYNEREKHIREYELNMKPGKPSHHSKTLRVVLPPRSVARKEILREGVKTWYPIQFLINSTKLCWTHFLALDEHIRVAKCKNCGEVIRNSSISRNKPLTKDFRAHLGDVHDIGPWNNYYKSEESNNAKEIPVVPSVLNLIRDENVNDENYATVFNPYGTLEGQRVILNRMLNLESNHFGKFQFLTLICILQNFKFEFMETNLFETLLDLLHLNIRINSRSLMENVTHIDGQVLSLVTRCIAYHAENLPLTLTNDKFGDDGNFNRSAVETFINSGLNQLLEMPLFSIEQYIYDGRFLVITLQYCDKTYFQRKYIPLMISQIPNDEIPNTFEIVEKLSRIFNDITGLDKSTLSIVLPSATDNIRSLLLKQQPPLKDICFHECFISTLVGSLIPFFGYISGNITTSEKLLLHPKDRTIIDNLLNLENIETYDSIFGKINRFYQEIKDSLILREHLKDACKETSNSNNEFKFEQFEKTRPSTAVHFLQSFLKYKEEIMAIREYSLEESFSLGDFELIRSMVQILSVSFDLINFFNDSTSQFHNVIVTVISLQNYIEIILQDAVAQKTRNFVKSFLDDIIACRKRISQHKDTLLSIFISPNMVCDKQALSILYPDVSFQDVLDDAVEIAFSLLKRFLMVEENTENTTIKDGVVPNTFERLAFTDFADPASANTDGNVLFDLILKNQIRRDFGEFIKIITKEYDIFFTQKLANTEYEKEDSIFKNKHTGEIPNPVTELLEIHLPISNAFLEKYMELEIGIVFTVIVKCVIGQSSSSFSSALHYLFEFQPANQETLLAEIIRVRTFANQFNIMNVVWEEEDLFTICKFPGLR